MCWEKKRKGSRQIQSENTSHFFLDIDNSFITSLYLNGKILWRWEKHALEELIYIIK